MKIGIFTQFGAEFGFGNYSRMRTLANALLNEGAKVSFIVDDELIEIVSKDFSAVSTAQTMQNRAQFDIGIFDYPAKLYKKMNEFSDLCSKIVLIDDNAINPSRCDLIVNYNLHAASLDYSQYAFMDCLLGAKYALIRSEFEDSIALPQTRKEIVISFGGGKTGGLGIEVAAKISQYYEGKINLVLGSLSNIEELRLPKSVEVFQNSNLVPIMARSWAYIGGAGVTLIEAISSGLSLIVAPVAQDQLQVCSVLSGICDAVICGDVNIDNILCEKNANIIVNAAKIQLESAHITKYEANFERPNGFGAQKVARSILALK